MDTELVQRLIGIITETSPKLWEIAIRQVYVETFTDCVIGLLFFFGSFIWYKGMEKVQTNEDIDEEPKLFGWAVFVILSSITIISFLFGVISVSNTLLNPEYEAIKILLDLVK